MVPPESESRFSIELLQTLITPLGIIRLFQRSPTLSPFSIPLRNGNIIIGDECDEVYCDEPIERRTGRS